jgi:predicted dehydrogenase
MSQDRSISRRRFIRNSGKGVVAGGMALAYPSLFLNRTKAASGQNPSEFVRVGFIGVGGQGTHNLGALMKNAVAVCDVDQTRLEAAKEKVETANSRPCSTFSDYRKLLEDKSIDAVVISTPDHWHTLPALHACEAGKDIYCEKPLTLFIAEGQALVKAVRHHKRVFQTGSQQRSDAKFLKACEYIRSGHLGKIHTVKVGIPSVNYLERAKPPSLPDGNPPADLDYDMWLGPAPFRPYNKNRVHYLFRFFWDYSGGQMTNWGAHQLDITQWALGTDQSGPVEIQGTAVYNSEKLYETPQNFDVTFKYENGTVVQCSGGTGKFKGGVRFEGEKGSIHVNRGALECSPEEILEQPLSVRLYASTDHYKNWLDCIKTRKDPICSADIGHRSATVCHLGNIAIRTGKTVKWDPKTEQIIGDTALAGWVARQYRKPWRLPA